jgi:glycosyltransferase involved in cell wall biosynthesis
VRVIGFDVSGNRVRGFGFGDVEKYRKFLTESNFEIVVNFAAQQWATDLALPLLKKIKAKKVFVPTGFSNLYENSYKGYFEELKKQIFDYDACVFLSDDYRDILFARELGYIKNHLIPNGASEAEFGGPVHGGIREKLKISKDTKIILNVGSHTGAKGHKEAIQIFHDADVKDAALVIVGNNIGPGCGDHCRRAAIAFPFIGPVQFGHGKKGFYSSLFYGLKMGRFLRNFFRKKKIIVKSLSRSDTVDLFKEADVFLFPSKIECSPIVLFESMAAGTPFLATDVGNSKEIVKWSESGFILPTVYDGSSRAKIAESARLLEQLLQDGELRKSLSQKGREAWLREFTWEKIVQKYEQTYLQL